MQSERLKKEQYIGTGKHLAVIHRRAYTFPLHAHEYFEVEIVLNGSGIHFLNGKQFPVQRGSIYLISPADFHKVIVSKPMELWNISFDETLLSPAQLEDTFLKRPSCRQLNEKELKKISTAAELLYEEYLSEGYVQPLIDYILALVMQQAALSGQITPLRRAILFIQTHFRENPSLKDAAAQACLSPVYFGNLFKKEMGQTYTNYINTRKINCAMMLLESGLSVNEACFSSGFGSLSGFLHTFKQHTGFSPQQYKEQNAVCKKACT